jgi:hypothetical protein
MTMGSVVRKWLLILLALAAGGVALVGAVQYRLAAELLPAGTTVAEVDVSGLTVTEARTRVTERYDRPLYLYHRADHVELNPRDVGFQLDLDGMFTRLQQQLDARQEWLAFLTFVLKRPLRPVQVPLLASHDEAALRAMVESIASFLDVPARPPQMLSETAAAEEGQPGYLTNVEASVTVAAKALYRLEDRAARLVIVDQPAPPMTFEALTEVINGRLQGFDGMGSIFIMDLASGEEIGINADVAMSGLSILKIAVFVEAFRALDGTPNPEQQTLLLDTAAHSSNYGANLLLHVVAGESNTYRGADILTESMRRLGLVNTFMAVPYDATPPAYRQTT